MTAKTVTAGVIIIGNEVLSGRTRDANLNYLARRLDETGVRLMEARVIPDSEAVIVEALNETRAAYDYVITTGGIGPTHDDITSAAVAKAFGVEVERSEAAMKMLRQHYSERPEDLNEARRKMADVPAGAELIENPVSKAPGYRIGNVFVLAGVPMIMEAMFEGIKDRLKGGPPMHSLTVSAYLVEGVLAAGMGEIQERFTEVEVGSYPFMRTGRLGVSIVFRSTDEAAAAAAAGEFKELVRSLGGEPVDDGES